MDDRELLELAAKAAGIEVRPHPNRALSKTLLFIGSNGNWNPLTDDGDALRLAVKLQLEIYIDHRGVAVRTHCGLKTLEKKCDATATRRAIVRAAAEIGRAM